MPAATASASATLARRARVLGLGLLAGGAISAAAPQALAAPRTYALDASGELKRTARPSALSTIQRGTLRGRPFGSGTMTLRSTLNQARVSSTFTLQTAAGIVRGRATARLTLDGDTATYRGSATITSGTRRYRNARATNIRFTGVGPVSAKQTRITLSGRVRY